MYSKRYAPAHRSHVFLSCLVGALLAPLAAVGQEVAPQSVQFRVQGPSQRLEMIVNSSRILALDKEIPRALVNNTEIVRVVPISPRQIQVSAIKPGVTQVNLWDEDGEVYSVDVVIYGDARQLEMLLRAEFPHAALRVRPLASSVVLSGFVDRPEIVGRIVRMAEDYYPKVINNITVGGVQQVSLHVKVMEVSRTKLRAIGFDWANLNNGDYIIQSVSGLISDIAAGAGQVVGTGGQTVAFGIVDGNNQFFGFLEALRQNNLIKVLAEPTLVAVSGRPASFNVGGEFPILVPQSLGTISVEFKQFGTRVDFVPIVLGNGNIRLEVRPQVSEVDNSRNVVINGQTVPGLRTRWVDTAVEMRAGQTLALAGLIQNRVEAENRGIPWLADIPWAGAAFRRVEESVNEIELLVMVRPELVDALDPHEVPPCGPGQFTTSPNDVELYWRGYLEVPNCCTDGSCSRCQSGGDSSGPSNGPTVAPEVLPSTTTSSALNGQTTSTTTGRTKSKNPLNGQATDRPVGSSGRAVYSIGVGSEAMSVPIPRSEYPPSNSLPPSFPSRQRGPRDSNNSYNPDNSPFSTDGTSPSESKTQLDLLGPTGYDNLDY